VIEELDEEMEKPVLDLPEKLALLTNDELSQIFIDYEKDI